jgi:hypothetical protein
MQPQHNHPTPSLVDAHLLHAINSCVSRKILALATGGIVFAFLALAMRLLFQVIFVVGFVSAFGDTDQVTANAAALASIIALVLAAVAAKFAYSRVARRALQDSNQPSL